MQESRDLFKSSCGPLTPAQKGGLKILEALSEEPRSSMGLYDKLAKASDLRAKQVWADAGPTGAPPEALPTRQKLVGNLFQRLGCGLLNIEESFVELSDDPPARVQVTSAPFIGGLCLSLGQMVDCAPGDITIDSRNPSSPPAQWGLNHEVSEFASGRRALNDYAAVQKKYGDDVIPFPIILESDKTHTDHSGKLTIEQVNWSPAWHTRQVRRHPLAWKVLGFIPNSVLFPTDHHQEAKLGCTLGSHTASDYHAVLRHLFRDIREINRKGGIKCHLRLPATAADGSTEVVDHGIKTIYPYILCHCGDSEGGDKGCCIRAKSKQICRFCKVPRDQCGDPSIKSDNKTQTEVSNLVKRVLESDDEAAAELLKELSVHPVISAYMDGIELLSGGPPRGRGVFSLSPPELMHLIQKGWHKYILEGFYGMKRLTDDAELSSRFIIPAADWHLVDLLASEVGSYLSRSSDTDLPRTNFKHGVTSDVHRSASEMQPLIIFIAVILSTEAGQSLSTVDKERRDNWLRLVDRVLLMEEFMKSTDGITVRDLRLVGVLLKDMMVMFRQVVDRKVKSGMNFIKFHVVTHLHECMEDYGLMQNVSGQSLEQRHKFNAKDPAKKTQRRIEKFDYQVGLRALEQHATRHALAHLDGRGPFPFAPGRANVIPREGGCDSPVYYVAGETVRFNVRSGLMESRRNRKEKEYSLAKHTHPGASSKVSAEAPRK